MVGAEKLMGFLLTKLDCLMLTQVGFVSIPFNLQKRYSYGGYSRYVTTFNSLLEAVYPVSVKANLFHFTQIIGYNYVNIYRIPWY